MKKQLLVLLVALGAIKPIMAMQIQNCNNNNNSSVAQDKGVHLASIPSKDGECFIDDMNMNIANFCPADISKYINQYCGEQGPLTQEAKIKLSTLVELDRALISFHQLSPDGKLLWITYKNGHNKLIDMVHGIDLLADPIRKKNIGLDVKIKVKSVVFSPDSTMLFVCFKGESSKLIDIIHSTVLCKNSAIRKGIKAPMSRVQFSPDSKKLWIGFRGTSYFNLIDIKLGQTISKEGAFLDRIFSPDSRMICTKKGNSFAAVEIKSEEILIAENNVYDYKFSPDSKMIVLKFNDGSCRIFDLVKKSFLGSHWQHVEFSPDSKMIYVKFKDSNGCFQLTNIESKEILFLGDHWQHIKFSPDSKMICVSLKGGYYQIIDIKSKKDLFHESDWQYAESSPNSKMLCVRLSNGYYQLIDIESKKVLLCESDWQCVRFSSDSKMIYVSLKGGYYQIIDIKSKKKLINDYCCNVRNYKENDRIIELQFLPDEYVKFIDFEFLLALNDNLTLCQALYLKSRVSLPNNRRSEHGQEVFNSLPNGKRLEGLLKRCATIKALCNAETKESAAEIKKRKVERE